MRSTKPAGSPPKTMQTASCGMHFASHTRLLFTIDSNQIQVRQQAPSKTTAMHSHTKYSRAQYTCARYSKPESTSRKLQ